MASNNPREHQNDKRVELFALRVVGRAEFSYPALLNANGFTLYPADHPKAEEIIYPVSMMRI